jgi:nitroreductase
LTPQNDTLRTIHSLHSTHGNFTDQEVGEADLRTVLDAAVRAPNASARQSYSIVVIQDRALMKQLCGYQGSKALLFCIDYTRITATANHLGHPFSADGFVSFVTGTIDTVLAAQTAAIAAQSLGIDTLFTNGIHRGDMMRVYDLLDLPEKHCFPLIMLVLGYADQEPEYLRGRLNGPGVVHWDTYHRPPPAELDALVAQYDDPASHLGLDDAWREQGLVHYLDWFYTVWSNRGPSRTGKSQMYELVEQLGFLDAD